MSDKTKKVIKFTSTGITVLGVVGLYVSGASEVEVSNAVKVGTMIASIIAAGITAIIPKK